MNFKHMTQNHAESVEKLFCDTLKEDGLVYQPFSDRQSLLDFFLPQREAVYRNVTILDLEESAFASGCYIPGEERAYITFLTVTAGKRRQGIGRSLLKELEKCLMCGGAKKLEIVFFNPMTFTWLIPGSEGASHPNAPGIDMGTPAYLFFQKCGYQEYAIQNSYYLQLSDYMVSLDLAARETALAAQGIYIEEYKKEIHHGLKELICGFGNPMWEREILEAANEGSRPVLIVSDHLKAVGFTGPMDVEVNKRGYFAGIGLDHTYRGRRIAGVLFARLCAGLKEQGARYMTLFTGNNNPARYIYEAAGFRIVKTWAVMRKTEGEVEK